MEKFDFRCAFGLALKKMKGSITLMKTRSKQKRKQRIQFSTFKDLEKETLEHSANLSYKERLHNLTRLLRIHRPEMFYKNGKPKPLKRKIYFPDKSE